MDSIRNILLAFFAITICLVGCRTIKETRGDQSLQSITKQWDGYERSYLMHLPPKEKLTKPLPILFVLHGGGGTPKQISNVTLGRFNQLADQEGFIVIYPQGYEKSWNDGRNLDLAPAWVENMDDVGFITSIVDDLKSNHSINTDRIFTTGISNGGFMSSRLLCDRADLFRGGAILTASISLEYFATCNPSQPIAVLLMNGTDDPIVPYAGGDITLFNKTRGRIISTDDYLEFWQLKNNCNSNAEIIQTIDNEDDGTVVEISQYSNCSNRGSLVLYKIIGGGHTWPGAKSSFGEKILGKTSKEINACEVIWAYFKSLD